MDPSSEIERNLERFVAVWDFEPSKQDEVGLSKGDIVLVVKKYKDGWFRGIRCRGYQAGCFPGNFVAKDCNEGGTVGWQEVSQNIASLSLSTGVNEEILQDLKNDRTKLTSEDSGTDDQCKDGQDRQPDVNHNALEKRESLNGGNVSPGPFTSFHGLSLIADRLGQDGEESGERKRTKIAMELLTSEVSYFNGLNLLSGHYIRPLRKLRIVSNEDLKRIFSNVESLESISKELVAKLQTRLARWDVNTTQIGDVLLEMFSYLKMFEPYFNSRKRGNEVKAKLERNNEKFKNFLSKVNCNHTLDSLLLMPIQRVPRYKLILQELVKSTREDHPDYENLKEALGKADKAAETLNEHIRQIDNENKVVEVIKSFPNDELNLIRPTAQLLSSGILGGSVRLRKHERGQLTNISKTLKRISLPLMESIETSPRIPRSATATHIAFSLRGEESSDSDSEAEPPPVGDSFITSTYIYEGDVERVTKKATGSSEGGMVHETVERHLFLFNNVLLIGMASENLLTGKKTYKLKDSVALSQAWVVVPSTYYASPPDNMFLLGAPTQIYKFLAPSQKEKETWEMELKKYIQKEKEAFVQSFNGLPVPDEEFLAASIQAKIDYFRTTELELNLRQNEEVLIIGVRSGDQWLPYQKEGLYSESICEFELAWWPGLCKGRFGWFPAQCVTGPDIVNLSVTDKVHPVPTAVALNSIKRSMMNWTGSSPLPAPFAEEMTTLKVFKPNKTFKTCKVEPHFLVSDVISQYTRHKSFVGGKIDAEVLELWEESLDGSVHRCLDSEEQLGNVFHMWGKYKDKMKLVIHTVTKRQGQQLCGDNEKCQDPPTGL